MDFPAATGACTGTGPALRHDRAPPRRAGWRWVARLPALTLAIAALTSFPGTAPAADQRAGHRHQDFALETVVDDEGAIGILTLPDAARHGHRRTPAVVLLSDGAGPDRRSFRYIEHLRHAGIAALDVQLYEISADGAASPSSYDRSYEAERLRRAIGSLRRHSDVEFTLFAAIGFGRGAHPLALATFSGDGAIDLAARVLLYPGCKSLNNALEEVGESAIPSRGPVLLLYGDDDPANAQRDCDALAGQLAAAGVQARAIRYRGATYGWDIPAAGDSGTTSLEGPDGERLRVMAWQELADMSAAQAIAFVARALTRAGP